MDVKKKIMKEIISKVTGKIHRILEIQNRFSSDPLARIDNLYDGLKDGIKEKMGHTCCHYQSTMLS